MPFSPRLPVILAVLLCLPLRMTAETLPHALPNVMRPSIAGGWMLIGPPPDLKGLIPPRNTEPMDVPEPNDHHLYRDDEGRWHLWACVRGTDVGRVLAHYEGPSLTEGPWTFTGDLIRADRNAGESLIVWNGQEFIQSPFIVKKGDTWHMFYGGYATGYDTAGDPTTSYSAMQNQISRMTSPDGRTWKRALNEEEYSRVFVGPGAARDPCVVKFGDTWYCYYTGHHNEDLDMEAIYVRTSRDLENWSDWKIAHFVDPPYRSSFTSESPTVVEHDGLYYLFRSGGYTGDGSGSVSVFVSTDPMDFGRSGDGSEHYVANIDAHAPEIVTDADGRQYITRIFAPDRGYAIEVAPLKWVPAAR